MEKDFNSKTPLNIIISCLLMIMFEAVFFTGTYANPVFLEGGKKDTLIIKQILHGVVSTKGDSYFSYKDSFSDSCIFRYDSRYYRKKSVLYCKNGAIDSVVIFKPEGQIWYGRNTLLEDSLLLIENNWSSDNNDLVIENGFIQCPEYIKGMKVEREQNEVTCILGRYIFIFTCDPLIQLYEKDNYRYFFNYDYYSGELKDINVCQNIGLKSAFMIYYLL